MKSLEQIESSARIANRSYQCARYCLVCIKLDNEATELKFFLPPSFVASTELIVRTGHYKPRILEFQPVSEMLEPQISFDRG